MDLSNYNNNYTSHENLVLMLPILSTRRGAGGRRDSYVEKKTVHMNEDATTN